MRYRKDNFVQKRTDIFLRESRDIDLYDDVFYLRVLSNFWHAKLSSIVGDLRIGCLSCLYIALSDTVLFAVALPFSRAEKVLKSYHENK